MRTPSHKMLLELQECRQEVTLVVIFSNKLAVDLAFKDRSWTPMDACLKMSRPWF